MQVDWATVVGGAPDAGLQEGLQLASLAWLPGWPIVWVMDSQGRCAAINSRGRLLGVHIRSPRVSAGTFQNLAYAQPQAASLTHSAWRSGHDATPTNWCALSACGLPPQSQDISG